MPNQDVLGKYEKVRSSLEEAINVSDDIELAGEEENAELAYIRGTLDKLNSDFKAEIEQLENSAEWDRFCMAFFGETNAGKSTIIEALRIVYDEESRRNTINEQGGQLLEEKNKEEKEYTELIDALKRLNASLVPQKKSKLKPILIAIGFTTLGVICGFVFAILIL